MKPALYGPDPKPAPRQKAPKRPVKARSTKRGTGSRVPPGVVEEVALRSGGWCECAPGCRDRVEALHHRLPRSRGGRDEVDNLLGLSHRHHQSIHAHPERSYRLGLLLRSTT